MSQERSPARAMVASLGLLGAVALASGCATGGVEAPDGQASIAEADLAAAKAWREQFSLGDPILDIASACAHLRESQAAFTERLPNAAVKAAPQWRGAASGFLEAPLFEVYRTEAVRLRMSANLLNGESVCAVRFEGRLGAAVWEDQRRWFRDRPIWAGPDGTPGGRPDENARRLIKSNAVERVTFFFTEASRRDPPGLLMEFRRPEAGVGGD